MVWYESCFLWLKSEETMFAGRVMQRFRGLAAMGVLAVGLVLAAGTTPAAAQTTDESKTGFYILLNKEFFEAMTKLSREEATTYGDRQEPLLQQIAVASQFMVKTNLTLIRQNERIINLLEELNRKRPVQEK